jgi:hypothetical protein
MFCFPQFVRILVSEKRTKRRSCLHDPHRLRGASNTLRTVGDDAIFQCLIIRTSFYLHIWNFVDSKYGRDKTKLFRLPFREDLLGEWRQSSTRS